MVSDIDNIHVYRTFGTNGFNVHFVLESSRGMYYDNVNWEYLGTLKNYINCIIKELTTKKCISANLIR